jgi:probable F420-dependent oxidoreductase
MQFGLSAPFRGPMANPEDLRAIAQAAERLGFGYMTVSDHILCPRSIDAKYPYADDGEFPWTQGGGGDCMEQFTLMAWLCAATTKLRLLTSVVVIPHRNPLFMAKSIATMDVLSGGRVSIGCGTGWMREEFEALGIAPFEKRGQVTNEYIGAMKALWTQENPSYDGEFVKFRDVIFDPKPVQKPHPPLWIGGESGPAMRRVAAVGDVWYPFASNPKFRLASADAYRDRAQRVQQAVAEAGRDPADVGLAYNSPYHSETAVQLDGQRVAMTGTAEQRAGDARAFAEAGAQTMMVNLTANTRSEMLDRMERFAAEVMPLV